MTYRDMGSPELIIEHTGQVFPLTDEVVTIGHERDNTIVLADPEVSGHHARITWSPRSAAYYLEDLGSIEGTFVNERAIGGPVKLHHGDVIRIGNTVMGLSWQSSYQPEPLVEEERGSRFPVLVGIVAAVLAVITLLCLALFAILLLGDNRNEPDVTFQSPADNSRIVAGDTVILQATASGARDITVLELSVDGVLVGSISSPSPAGTSLLTVSKSWSFDRPGEHQVSAEAFTAEGRVSEPASIDVTVVAATQDVPTAEATVTPSPTPSVEPTATLTPTAEPSATPTLPPPPQIQYFQASPASLYPGECATLQWGEVSNAEEITIDPDVGAVEAPGAEQVCPEETTTYVLTAEGLGGSNSASTTVTVVPRLADLTIDSISFNPPAPREGQDTEVVIAVRNIGAGPAPAFDWTWQPGSEDAWDGRLPGLEPGERTVVRLMWQPAAAQESLLTIARLDVGDEVDESNEENNELQAAIQVVAAPSQPETARLVSEGRRDGYWLNDGSGSNDEAILVGNGKIEDSVGELVSRGFMSFDLSSIPAGATIQSLELRFFQQEIQGNPYGKLGNLVLERVDFGGTLGAGAYALPALDAGTLDQQTAANAWYVLSDPALMDWLQRSLDAGSSRLQLRLRFSQETDGDGEEDWIAIAPGGGPLGAQSAPQLVVTYVP